MCWVSRGYVSSMANITFLSSHLVLYQNKSVICIYTCINRSILKFMIISRCWCCYVYWHVAVCIDMLLCVLTCCYVYWHVAMCIDMLLCVLTCCYVYWHVAMCIDMLLCVLICCYVYLYTVFDLFCHSFSCSKCAWSRNRCSQCPAISCFLPSTSRWTPPLLQDVFSPSG